MTASPHGTPAEHGGKNRLARRGTWLVLQRAVSIITFVPRLVANLLVSIVILFFAH